MKKKISLILFILMLLSIILPGLRTFANEEPTGKDVADKITVTNLNLENNTEGNTIDPNKSGGLHMSFDFDVEDNSVKEGDYFEIKLSDNMNFFGDSTASPVPNFYNSAKALIATGEYDEENHKLIYTFTDYVENSRNVKGKGEFTFWVDRYKVTDNGDQTFKVNVSDQEASTMLNVNFTTSTKLVDSFITKSDPFGDDFTQIVYVNPKHHNLEGTKLSIRADSWESKNDSTATINSKNTTFEIYKVPNDNTTPGFPKSFGVDKTKYESIKVEPKFGTADDKVEYVDFDFSIFSDNNTSDGTGYIIVMNSKKSEETGTLKVSAFVETTNESKFFWDNENIIESADTSIEGENVYQLGDFVWEDSNKNGIQDKGELGVESVKVTLIKPDGTSEEKTTDKNGYYIFDKLPNGTYTVKFETPNGYKSTDSNKGADKRFDSNGVESTVTINGSNDYTIDYGIVKVDGKNGTFVEEHHYFIEYRDANGKPVNAQGEPVEEGQNIIEQTDLEVIKEPTKGTKDESFSSKLINKEGYKYNSKKSETYFQGGTTIDENGNVSGNYVDEKEQKVVYNYYKSVNPKAEKGSVYVKYVTEDGKVLEAESVVKKDAPAGEEYTTEKKSFDGYEFVKMKDGSAPANGKVVSGEELHVTYVYKEVNSSDNTSGGSSNSGGSSRPDRPSRPHRPSGDNSVIIHYEPSNNNTNTNVTKPEVDNTTPQDNTKPNVTDDNSKANVTEDNKSNEVTTSDTTKDESRDRDDDNEAVGNIGPHDYNGPTGGSDGVKHLPKTGDGLNTSAYVGILLAAGAALTVAGLKARKKENEE
ncbi:SdrD B-like domain-containing protein [Peptoniphilus sp.]|jgi:LPXTG-motif cell wall-anchored protein|uniref:SdrD B-like domain-containing protein n=1 Tax=Peptoniphilus sp. TaxID=1971214 RepID=UPI003D905ECF